MIKMERPDLAPASLVKPYGNRVRSPKLPHLSEQATVIQRMLEHRLSGEQLEKFKFPFERYSDKEVIESLRSLFKGKCAYCESRYAGTQPMDVEHWRPKGEIKDSDTPSIKPGYYWLAAEWTNLLPSCIDCNRGRRQFDMLDGKNIVLGKKNQFPLLDSTKRVTRHEDDPLNIGGTEECLLINPCNEDPEELLKYDEDGLVLPRSPDPSSTDHKRAMASIRVYALNRAELVAERRSLILNIDHRLRLIASLGKVRSSLDDGKHDQVVDTIADLIAAEIDVLLKMENSDQVFAGLARQFIAEADPLTTAG